MARPTFPTCRTVISGGTVLDTTVTNAKLAGSINGSKLLSGAVGLTQAATVIERKVVVATLAATPSTGQAYVVFRGPTSGARITAAAWTPGSDQNHAVNEGDTWKVRIYNKRTGSNLNNTGGFLSGITLLATAWATIRLDTGKSTVQAGETLWASFGISGSPAALNNPAVYLEWTPLNNA